jgi:hypothetical protein
MPVLFSTSGRRQQLAVARKGDRMRTASDRPFEAYCLVLFAVADRPEPDVLAARGGQGCAVLREGHRLDRAGVFRQHQLELGLLSFQRPKLYVSVRPAGDQGLAVQREQ